MLDVDLLPTVSLNDAHTLITQAFAQFARSIVNSQVPSTSQATTELLAPIVESMVQESSWLFKPPCNPDELIAPDSLTCWSGTQWVQDNLLNAWIARNPEWNPLITVIDDDSFHQASEVYPYHHPEVDGQCAADTQVACTVTHISNTELSYGTINDKVLER